MKIKINKKAEVDLLPKVLVLIVINLLFFSLFFFSVQTKLSQVSFEEKIHARRIALMIDMLEKDSILRINLEELTKLYSTDIVDIDTNTRETARLISEATNSKIIKNTDMEHLYKSYDAIDNITHDNKLEDVYTKIYIKEQYIFMDDNIKTLRNKVCISLPLSQKYGNDIMLLPEYTYFWTEYNLNNTLDRVMLGQKWIRRNELVSLDIKPNENLSVYENLRNNLSYLKNSFGIKLKREDDEYNILEDYENYMTNYEIYMIDIINELGLNYNSDSDKKKNIYEVYVNIYYPMISFDRFENIIDLLNTRNMKELDKNINSSGTIRNEGTMEKHIYNIVYTTQADPRFKKFTELFKPNYIIQSIIYINLNNPKNLTGTISNEKYNLYKIFDNFIVSEKYPFIQYQTPDAQLTYKFYTKTKNTDDNDMAHIFTKWFENAPYGISFKIKADDTDTMNIKYMSISFNDIGRLEYKITWREEDEHNINTIKRSSQTN